MFPIVALPSWARLGRHSPQPKQQDVTPPVRLGRTGEIMVDDPAYLKNLRALTRSDPKVEHARDLERELYTPGNDRATAVLLGSFVDTHLGRLLASVMRSDLNSKDRKQVFEYEGAVGTFSTRIVMAYALNLVGPLTRLDLDLIRILRNEFAHSRMPISFSTPEIRDVCAQFKVCDLRESQLPIGYLDRVSHGELNEHTGMTNPKARFVASCHSISYRMLVKRDGPQAGDFVFAHDEPLP